MPPQWLMHRNLTVGFRVCSVVLCRVEFVRFPEPTCCNDPNNGREAASGVGKTARGVAMLSHLPIQSPADWLGFLNEPQTAAELAALRLSVNRGCPLGDDEWTGEVVGP